LSRADPWRRSQNRVNYWHVFRTSGTDDYGFSKPVKALFSRANGVLAACTVGNAVGVTPMVYTVFGLFLIPVSTEFGWPRSAVSLVLLVLAIAGALSYPVVGRIIDRYGARRVILVGNILFAMSVGLVSTTSASPAYFYFIYALVGITAAIPSTVMYTKVIAGWFDSNRGFALGFAGGFGNGIGAAIAPVFVASLIASYGWRGAHLGIALVILAVGFPVLFLLLRDAPSSQITNSDESNGMTLAEARKTKPFWIILIAVALGAGCMTAVFAHVVPMLVDRNISMDRAVSVLITFSLVTAVWQVGMGYILDRFPKPWIAAPFYILAMIGLILLESDASYPLLLVAGALMGLGLGTEYGVLPYFLSRYFGVRHYGAISGMIYGVIVLTQGVTPFLMDLNFDASGNYRAAVVVICAAMLASAYLLTRLKPFATARGRAKDEI
jgi:MFS family permease